MCINRKGYLNKYFSFTFHLKNHIFLKTTEVIHIQIISTNTKKDRKGQISLSLHKVTPYFWLKRKIISPPLTDWLMSCVYPGSQKNLNDAWVVKPACWHGGELYFCCHRPQSDHTFPSVPQTSTLFPPTPSATLPKAEPRSSLAFCPSSPPHNSTPPGLLFRPLNNVCNPAGQRGRASECLCVQRANILCLLMLTRPLLLLQDWQLNPRVLQGPTFTPLHCKLFFCDQCAIDSLTHPLHTHTQISIK